MNNKSFTLIELLVVIVIIGILAGVIVVSTSSNIAKAQDTKLTSAILGLNKALKIYSLDSFPIETIACNVKTSCANLKSKIDIPNIDQDIYYKTSPSGNFFVIYANKPSNTNLSFEINSDIEDVKEVPSFTNLVAYYPLSIGTSNGTAIADMSPNSNNGTNYGANFAEGNDGNMNTGMSFNSDYIKVDNFNNSSNLSIFCWVNISSDSSWIINKRDNSTDLHWQLIHYENSLKAQIFNGSGIAASAITNSIVASGWRHVGFTTGGTQNSQLKLYLDGVNIATDNLLANMKLGIREMLIGTTAWSYSSALSYKGSMSNIRI